ncbi:hypothetical protein [Streptomyces sp. NPDC002215]|uniref:hypothetical protein n=1 Tax=Streptomyces sp. NPDC002215 TaxID=3154412 RepID=UPI00332A96CE
MSETVKASWDEDVALSADLRSLADYGRSLPARAGPAARGTARQLWAVVRGPGPFFRSLVTGSWVIVKFLARSVRAGVRLGWATAMRADQPQPAAPAAAAQKDGAPVEQAGAGTSKKPGTKLKSAPGGGKSPMDRLEALGIALLAVLIFAPFALVLLGTAVFFAWRFAAPYATWIAYGMLTVWAVAALAVAPPPRATTDTPVNDQEIDAGETDTRSPQERHERDLAAWIIREVAKAEEAELLGVHLATLVTRLQTDKTRCGNWDVTRLRLWCDAAGIPTNKKLKASGFGPTWGVRVDELKQALPMPLHEAARALEMPPPRRGVPATAEGPARAPVQDGESPPATPQAGAPVGVPQPTPSAPQVHPVPQPSPEEDL